MNSQILERSSLTELQISRMFELMSQHYDCVSLPRFEEDLAWKDQVILLQDDDAKIQGFSTIALNPANTAGKDYDVFYSGDTIVAKEHWGSQELVHGFSRAAGRAKKPGRRLIWLLLSKGHRTYLYLTLFAKRYFPALEPERSDLSLAEVTHDAAAKLFGADWKPDLGIVQFPNSHGQLKSELAEGKSNHRHAEFFANQNPGYIAGDELVCATELTPENLRRHVRRKFEEGAAEAAE